MSARLDSYAMGALLVTWVVSSASAAGPAVQSAHVALRIIPPNSCEAAIELTVAGASEVEHRLERLDGTRVELIGTHGAQQVGDIRTIGRTESLILRPEDSEDSTYGFRYRIEQPGGRADRCPIWLPVLPTDGRPGAVRLEVDLPAGAAVPADTLPTFTWNATHGSAALANLPAVVRVPLVRPGDQERWSVRRLMDVLTVGIFVAASAIWVWRVRR